MIELSLVHNQSHQNEFSSANGLILLHTIPVPDYGPWCPVRIPTSAVNAIKTFEFIFQAVDIGHVIYFKTDVILVSVHVGLFDYFNVVLAKGCI